MRLKNVVIYASLSLSSLIPISSQATVNFNSFDDKYINNINVSFTKRDNIILEREKIIKDISQGKNKEFPSDNIGKLEWVKPFSDYEVNLLGKGYVVKIIDNETKEPRYFGAKTDDIWLTPKNIKNFNFAISGFNFGVHNVNPLPIKDIETINYISSFKGSIVTSIKPIYVNYKKFFDSQVFLSIINSSLRLDSRFLIKKEDFFESYIFNINGIYFYAKEMYLNNNKLYFKENNVYGEYNDFNKIIEQIR